MSDIDFEDSMKLYKKCTAKPYSFLVNNATLPLENLSSFRFSISERISKAITTIDEKIRSENTMQY